MIDKESLCGFLVKAKKATYASGDFVHAIKEKDGSTTLVFEEGDFRYHDNYFGGEPFGGREVVFFRNEPIYMMVYYGYIEGQISDYESVYQVLRDALKLIPKTAPFRGPERFEEGAMVYENSFTGGIECFSGREAIVKDNREIYQAGYMGGVVDRKDRMPDITQVV
jgi:hypothetical protein